MIVNLLVYSLAVLITAYILPGVKVDSYFTALAVAVILGIVNTVLKPILIIITLPIAILTLGLFTFVINALMIELVAAIVPGFTVSSLPVKVRNAGAGWSRVVAIV